MKWTEKVGCSSLKFKYSLQTCTITIGKELFVLHENQPLEDYRGEKDTNSWQVKE